MGIVSGSMTVGRFRVMGELHDGWRDLYRDRLNEFAFTEPPVGIGKEEVEGWTQVHNLLDTEFDDYNRWLYNDFAVFALRVDKKRLPAKLFKATLDKKCQAWCAEREIDRCPASVRNDIKDALEADWLKRTLPAVAVTECSWSITGKYLLLHSLSEGTTDRFKKRFFRTFGLKLVPWSPLDWLSDRAAVEGLIAKAPARIELPNELPPLVDDDNADRVGGVL